MKPKEVVEKWVQIFNTGNTNDLADLYHNDATNHQVVAEPLIGREAIRNMFENEFKRAEMTCIIENIFEDGDWAILEWKDPLGLRGCGFFHVIDDKIKFQRGYFDTLSFLRQQKLPLPSE